METLLCALKTIYSFVCFQFFVILFISVTTRNLRKAHKKRNVKGITKRILSYARGFSAKTLQRYSRVLSQARTRNICDKEFNNSCEDDTTLDLVSTDSDGWIT